MSEQHSDEHETFIKTPKQLIWAVVLAFVIPIALIALLVKFVGFTPRTGSGADAMSESATLARIAPVGGFQLADAGGPAKVHSGEEVYTAQCAACHDAGVAGSPKLGDEAAWAPRIATGYDALLNAALKGKGAMAAQGGGKFSDTEIGKAVVYMTNTAGGDLPQPADDAGATDAQDKPADKADAAAPASDEPKAAAAAGKDADQVSAKKDEAGAAAASTGPAEKKTVAQTSTTDSSSAATAAAEKSDQAAAAANAVNDAAATTADATKTTAEAATEAANAAAGTVTQAADAAAAKAADAASSVVAAGSAATTEKAAAPAADTAAKAAESDSSTTAASSDNDSNNDKPAIVARAEQSGTSVANMANSAAAISASAAVAKPTTADSLVFSDASDITPATGEGIPKRLSVFFGSGKSDVSEKAVDELFHLIYFTKSGGWSRIGLSGYTDGTGNAEVNTRLSRERMRNVRDALVDIGVAEDRIVMVKPEQVEAAAGASDSARRVDVYHVK